ncbi:sigma-B regulation protein RsbU (phosphoserine phosphatase) [Evansella caseinilytica]|uniref:Sigma-B regulation protein RsbU (Phosphoserine phosphatase) n=1 Tax=Evansella caseinilytica TaxID=1503961 RepID=A0A1H3QIZ9_9BACI|nr:PP2C family protein-serine/threonine phosphatase [Evansella caseinilytica]SDZ13270.1 sigma-B regulation protein RsbU (phosphoserine phosphatase) [Evansella caseinilytica]
MEKTKLSMYRSYRKLLHNYLGSNREEALHCARQWSKKMIDQDMSPEEMVSLHVAVFKELVAELPMETIDSFDLLLEVMNGYGRAHREHLNLRDRQRQLDAELEIAARMQKSLLQENKLNVKGVDFGVISVPAGIMSGDYYHYDIDDHGHIGVAVADVIGKGIPAAMCMSMIKYAMDMLPAQRLRPGTILQNLNRVVARNIDDDMFITMTYGSYNPECHHFCFASAGHEPGFIYSANTDMFHDMETKGIVLGVSPNVAYQEYTISLRHKGDFIVLLSDGVTETRINGQFLERNHIIQLIRKYIHLPAQTIVEQVHSEMEKIQGFQRNDDFTLMILRRNV